MRINTMQKYDSHLYSKHKFTLIQCLIYSLNTISGEQDICY